VNAFTYGKHDADLRFKFIIHSQDFMHKYQIGSQLFF